MSIRLTLVVTLLECVTFSSIGFAHSGRLDSNGGHHDRRNGGYHYHGGGPSSSSYSPSIRLEPRYEPRTGVNTSSRAESRRSTRVEAKPEPRRAASKTRNYTWNFQSTTRSSPTLNAEAESAAAPLPLLSAAPNPESKQSAIVGSGRIVYYQMLKSEEDDHLKSQFVAVRDGEESKPLRENKPAPDEALLFVRSVKNKDADLKIFLNGMSRQEAAWVRIALTGDEVSMWTRVVEDNEFSDDDLVQLKYPFRTWTDSGYKFSRTARYFSRSGNIVTLLDKDGAQIDIAISKLSKEDIAYLENPQASDQ